MNLSRSWDWQIPPRTQRRSMNPWVIENTRVAQKVYDDRASVQPNSKLLARWKVAEARRWMPVLATMEKIEKLAALAPNWDDHDAPPANRVAMAKTLRLISTVSALTHSQKVPKVDAVISPDGGFLVEWDSQHRVVQIQVHPGGSMSVTYADDPDSFDSEWHEIDDVDFRTAVTLAQSAC